MSLRAPKVVEYDSLYERSAEREVVLLAAHVNTNGVQMRGHANGKVKASHLGVRGHEEEGKGHVGGRGVMALEHEGVDLLADVAVAENLAVLGGLDQQVEEGEATLLADELVLLAQILAGILGLVGLVDGLALLDHLVGEPVEDVERLVEFPRGGVQGEGQVVPHPRGERALEDDVAGLEDALDVVAVRVLLGSHVAAHGALADDVQSTEGDGGEHVDGAVLALKSGELVLEDAGLLIHNHQEVLEDLEVERGSEHLPPGVPLASARGQEAQSQPGVHELVVRALGDVLVGAEDGLEARGPGEDHVGPVSEVELHDGPVGGDHVGEGLDELDSGDVEVEGVANQGDGRRAGDLGHGLVVGGRGPGLLVVIHAEESEHCHHDHRHEGEGGVDGVRDEAVQLSQNDRRHRGGNVGFSFLGIYKKVSRLFLFQNESGEW